MALEILINIPKKVYNHPLVNESIINFTISEYTLVNGEIPPHLMSAGTIGYCEVTRSDGDETVAALRNPTEMKKLTKIEAAINQLRHKISTLKS